MAILLVLALAGCQSEAERSLPALKAWLARIEQFYQQHQRWPDRLEELQEGFASQEEFDRALHNPVTGAQRGYEYVKPPEWVPGTALAGRVVMLYQLRADTRADDLPVGYVSGQARLLQPGDITQTVPQWEPFRPPEAPVKVAFPTPPARERHSAAGSPLRGSDHTAPSGQTPRPRSQPSKPAPPGPTSGREGSGVWSYQATFCGLQYMLFGIRSALFYRVAQENPYQLLDQLAASLAQNPKTQIRRRQQLQIQNYPALDVELVLPELRHQFRVRWCLAEDRLYCLGVVGPEGTVNETNTAPFFQSFRVLPP